VAELLQIIKGRRAEVLAGKPKDYMEYKKRGYYVAYDDHTGKGLISLFSEFKIGGDTRL
jgi:hypothetical protein